MKPVLEQHNQLLTHVLVRKVAAKKLKASKLFYFIMDNFT
jgi:hypothetical protein